jgi:hypothetical protein
MGETVKLELQAFINEQLAGKFALQDKILSDKASEVATAYLRTLEEKTAAMGETLKNELQNYIKSSLEAAIPPAPPTPAPVSSLPPAHAPTPAPASSDEKGSGWDEARIVRVVEDAMERFAADRIGKPDFALRTAGASIIESRTSESYGQTWWSNLPVPFARRIITQPPTVILEPDVTVGRCWAFAGNQGRVTIELSEPVIPTSFTLDHVSPSIAHVRGLASAPKVFAVYVSIPLLLPICCVLTASLPGASKCHRFWTEAGYL